MEIWKTCWNNPSTQMNRNLSVCVLSSVSAGLHSYKSIWPPPWAPSCWGLVRALPTSYLWSRAKAWWDLSCRCPMAVSRAACTAMHHQSWPHNHTRVCTHSCVPWSSSAHGFAQNGVRTQQQVTGFSNPLHPGQHLPPSSPNILMRIRWRVQSLTSQVSLVFSVV